MPIRPITPIEPNLPPVPASRPPRSVSKVRADEPAAIANEQPKAATTGASLTAAPKPRRGHALKDENGKWLPTGDYDVGFGRPPVAHQFNGKPGPGRPRRELSHDHIMRRHLEQKRKVRIDGQEKTMSVLELVIATTIKGALQGKEKLAREVRHEIARLYPDTVRNETSRAARDSAAAAQILDQFFGDLGMGPDAQAPRGSNTADDRAEDQHDD